MSEQKPGDGGGDDRYDEEGGPDTWAEAKEIIVAEDGGVEAEVTIKAFGPSVESASKLCEALAVANRSIVHTVFSGAPDAPERSPDTVTEGNGTEDSDSRIMDWDGQ